MSWRCTDCYNYYADNVKNCTNPRCPSHPSQRKNNKWWKCKCGAYSYANARYCQNGHPKDTHSIIEGG